MNDRIRDACRRGLFVSGWSMAKAYLGKGRVLLKGRGEGVAITLDDGPDAGTTLRIADLLAKNGAKATFFCIGEKAQRHPEILRQLRGAGHVIGHHTYHHRTLAKLTPAAALAEIGRGRQTIEDILGEACPLFRPPHGRLSPCLLPALRAGNEIFVLWSHSLRDYGAAPPYLLEDRLRARGIHSGDILLAHDPSPAAPGLVSVILSLAQAERIPLVPVTSEAE